MKIKEWLDGDSPGLPDCIKKFPDFKVITFISEEYIKDYGDQDNSRDLKLGPFQGFDEEIVLQDILEVLTEIDGRILLIDKLHPSSTKNEGEEGFGENKVIIHIRQTELAGLLWYSELVIGMKSMGLLEASLMEKTALSYQPNLLYENNCTAVRLNLVPMITKKEDFRTWLKENVSRPGRKHRRRRFPFINESAVNYILGMGIAE